MYLVLHVNGVSGQANYVCIVSFRQVDVGIICVLRMFVKNFGRVSRAISFNAFVRIHINSVYRHTVLRPTLGANPTCSFSTGSNDTAS